MNSIIKKLKKFYRDIDLFFYNTKITAYTVTLKKELKENN